MRKQKGNIHKGRGYRERKTQNEVHWNIGSTPDVSKLNNSAHQTLSGFTFVASYQLTINRVMIMVRCCYLLDRLYNLNRSKI